MDLKKIVLGMLALLAVAGIVLQVNHANASYQTETIVEDLNIPWAMAWLPNGDMLVTERRGEILRIKEGEIIARLTGVPEVRAKSQGGLLDLVLDPDFVNNHLIYLSYADGESGSGSNTAIARARLDGDALKDLQVLYKAEPNTASGHHFGSRIAFDQHGHLYFSVGDRGDRNTNPQSKSRDGGKVYRIHRDGRVPEDNPFASSELPAMYSLGHRNIQGMASHPQTGAIWTHEHGPRGGDEVNLIQAGANYGWPILSYGVNYSGTSFAEGTERSGYESPVWYWDPSIAPSGMTFVTGDKYPEWRGHLLVGSLKFGQLVLCEVKGNKIINATPVLKNLGRVRDVRQAPDGYVYVAIDGVGIKRILPAD
ncbi:MAG: PQQ-dependent sugar dehydrogenase [Pseudomonadales bacterium]